MADIAVMRIALRLLLCATAFTPGIAAAQTALPDTITVTGTRQSPAEIHHRAVDFVHATGVAGGDVSAARWTTPVCPRAVGITDDAGRIVEAKLRTIATDAGIAVAPLRCTTNIAVVFATDGGAVVRAIVARAPRRLAKVPAVTVAALTHGTAPIRWWYSSEVADKDGMPANSDPPAMLLAAGGSTGIHLPSTEDTTFVQHYNNSLISTGNVRALRSATVVIDVTRTDGLPLDAVASFVAMVAFAEIRSGSAPPDSVLGLTTGGPVLRNPSAWDLAFLRALYRLQLDRTAQRQRGRLVADLVKARSD